MSSILLTLFFFFFNDTATTEIYTLSLHDALPIYHVQRLVPRRDGPHAAHGHVHRHAGAVAAAGHDVHRSEEHTSELQSQSNLVCRLLLEKKKKYKHYYQSPQPTSRDDERIRAYGQ